MNLKKSFGPNSLNSFRFHDRQIKNTFDIKNWDNHLS